MITLILFLQLFMSNGTSGNNVEILLLLNNGDEITFVKSVYTNLMSAEKVAKELNVEVIVDDTNNGVLVFTVNSEEQKDLAIRIFDEEGFETHAHTNTSIQKGKNYKAINIRTIENGEYIFELSNDEGDKTIKKVTIQND